ncbi:MAG: shikimate dehydrogenase [Candidatus Heimdallarchaeota archaeon]
MEVTGATGICCIIGSPVQHSLSPPMHNSAFKECQLDLMYIAFEVKPSQLGAAVAGLRALNVVGFNVTIPHKEAIIRYLDELEPSAGEMRAVNTVIRHNEALIGANTDGEGALRALREQGIDLTGWRIVILGAGGAARALSYAFSEHCDSIIFLNRTQKIANALSRELKQKGIKATYLPLTRAGIAQSLEHADMLVNATSVGMRPRTEESLIPPDLLRPELVIFDLVYNPSDTKLLRDAKKMGLTTIDGIHMLVYQGAIAFEKWTGKKAPIEIMRDTVINRLRGD